VSCRPVVHACYDAHLQGLTCTGLASCPIAATYFIKLLPRMREAERKKPPVRDVFKGSCPVLGVQ